MVNIVTSPIGTDCGWSAPVVGLYRQGIGLFEKQKKKTLQLGTIDMHVVTFVEVQVAKHVRAI